MRPCRCRLGSRRGPPSQPRSSAEQARRQWARAAAASAAAERFRHACAGIPRRSVGGGGSFCFSGEVFTRTGVLYSSGWAPLEEAAVGGGGKRMRADARCVYASGGAGPRAHLLSGVRITRHVQLIRCVGGGGGYVKGVSVSRTPDLNRGAHFLAINFHKVPRGEETKWVPARLAAFERCV